MSALAEEYRRRLTEPSDIRDHLEALHASVARFSEPRVVELGVRSGNSTAAFLAASEATGGHVWSVDVVQPTVPDWWATSSRWTLHIGSDLDPGIHAQLAERPGRCEVLFIDTLHTFEHTLAELRAYVPMVRPGGVVLLHDTELEAPPVLPPGTPRQPPFPVARALDRFCEETESAWENRPGCYGLGVLEVK